MSEERRIKVTPNGPYLVSGGVPLGPQTIETDDDGESVGWAAGEELHRHDRYSLCRCGASHAKPLCDGSHVVVGFDGTETASREECGARAALIEGPGVSLTDVVDLCSDTRFCHRRRIWNLVTIADTAESVGAVKADAAKCPSGRYTAVDPETGAVEPHFEPSIGLVRDPSEGVSGPIWVRGRIPVESADGHTYEVRNRMTLCRCGGSRNKPFCDGSHLEIGFKAE